MNKNKLLFFASFLIAMSAMTWSCKDEFSTEDQLRLQAELDKQAKQDAKDNAQEKDSVALSILVYNASVTAHSNGGKTSGIQGASGLTVKISAGGEILSQTTSAEGIANFWVQPGSISGTVSGTGVATANFTLTVTEAEDNEGEESGEQATNASVTLPVFANTGSTTAKVSGKVTFEGSLLNSTQENVPDGTVVTFRPDPASLQTYYVGITSTHADVDAYSFEGTFIATTTNGNYTINLPAGANGLSYTYTFNDFTADQSIAINNYNNELPGSVRDVVTISTSFGQGLVYQNLPTVLPVQFDIQAPPAAGTGATVNLRLAHADVTNAMMEVIAKGSGYPANSTNVPVTVNGGDFDSTIPGATAAVITATTNTLGQVTGLTVTTVGVGYRSRPTLTINGGGLGAIARVNWQSTIADESYLNGNGPSTVTAGGSGYLESNTPTILVTGLNTRGEVTSFNIGTEVANGSVVGINPSAGAISTITSAVVVSPTRVQAAVNSGTIAYGLSSLGELAFVGIANGGSGYADTPAPTVTVRGLRGGSGADVTAQVGNHAVSGLNVVNRGSGYSILTNANFPVGTAGAALPFSPASATLNLAAGQTKALDAYYGTGRRSREVQ